MYNIIVSLLLIFFLFNIMLLYVNAIREDFDKPNLINLKELWQKVYHYLIN